MRDIVLNYYNLNDDLIQRLANVTGQSFKELQEQFGYDQITGKYNPKQTV